MMWRVLLRLHFHSPFPPPTPAPKVNPTKVVSISMAFGPKCQEVTDTPSNLWLHVSVNLFYNWKHVQYALESQCSISLKVKPQKWHLLLGLFKNELLFNSIRHPLFIYCLPFFFKRPSYCQFLSIFTDLWRLTQYLYMKLSIEMIASCLPSQNTCLWPFCIFVNWQ